MDSKFLKEYSDYVKDYIKNNDKFNIISAVANAIKSKENSLAFAKFLIDKHNRFILRIYFDSICHILISEDKITGETLDKTISEFEEDLDSIDIVTEKCKYGRLDYLITAYYPLFKYTFIKIVYFKPSIDNGNYELNYPFLNERYKEENMDEAVLSKFLDSNDEKKFYRGQSNIKWTINPSMLRDLNQSVVLDYDFIKYHMRSHLRKYNRLMNYDGDRSTYNEYAFAQHSFAYSPLIDFTTNPIIATSFALANSNQINSFYQVDAAVYGFKPNKYETITSDKEISYILENESIIVLNRDGFFPGRSYKAEKLVGGKTVDYVKVSFTTFNEILKHLMPQFCFFDLKTNDRMIYQNGLFLFLYGENTVAFKDRIYYELNPRFDLTRYVIKKEDKEKFLKFIYEHKREYDYNHLMNPYLIFNE